MGDENANWSFEGAKALVEYLECYEEDQGEEIELDLVDIRSNYSEYPSLHHWAEDHYGYETDLNKEFNWDDNTDDEDKDTDIRNVIDSQYTLIEFNGGIIVSNY